MLPYAGFSGTQFSQDFLHGLKDLKGIKNIICTMIKYTQTIYSCHMTLKPAAVSSNKNILVCIQSSR